MDVGFFRGQGEFTEIFQALGGQPKNRHQGETKNRRTHKEGEDGGHAGPIEGKGTAHGVFAACAASFGRRPICWR